HRRARDRGVPRARGRGTVSLLELSGVETAYGRVRVLHGVSLHVNEGEIVALIGANGAGKTTTLRTISGLVHPLRGTVRFAGEDISRAAPPAIVRLGASQAPEGRRVFARMTV